MNRLLRRRIIIRERDYEIKFEPKARKLYTRVMWEPLTRDMLEKENVICVLKNPNKQPPWHISEPLPVMFWHQQPYLYNPRYPEWRFHELMGFIWCDAGRSNSTASRMGWATVEMDY